MSAVSYKLDNLTLFIDNNHMQSDGFSKGVLDISEKYAEILKSMGFKTLEVDGNDVQQLCEAFSIKTEPGKPRVIVGNSIKGKGVSFMENNPEWHHNRLTREQYELAIAELMV